MSEIKCCKNGVNGKEGGDLNQTAVSLLVNTV